MKEKSTAVLIACAIILCTASPSFATVNNGPPDSLTVPLALAGAVFMVGTTVSVAVIGVQLIDDGAVSRGVAVATGVFSVLSIIDGSLFMLLGAGRHDLLFPIGALETGVGAVGLLVALVAPIEEPEPHVHLAPALLSDGERSLAGFSLRASF